MAGLHVRCQRCMARSRRPPCCLCAYRCAGPPASQPRGRRATPFRTVRHGPGPIAGGGLAGPQLHVAAGDRMPPRQEQPPGRSAAASRRPPAAAAAAAARLAQPPTPAPSACRHALTPTRACGPRWHVVGGTCGQRQQQAGIGTAQRRSGGRRDRQSREPRASCTARAARC